MPQRRPSACRCTPALLLLLAAVAMLLSILTRPAQAFTSRALCSAGRKTAMGAKARNGKATVVRAPFLEPALAHAAVTRLFSTSPAAPEAAEAAAPTAAGELASVEWLDGGKAARLRWAVSQGKAGVAAHKVTYSREAGVVNQVTVGGASAEATLRGLVPGSRYTVEVVAVPAEGGGVGGGGGVVVAKGVVATPEEAAAPQGEVTELSRLEIRVGRIVEIGRHPDADTLYVEKIDVGEAEPRTIVSGLVKYQSEEAMTGRDVIVLCNLKPRAMRGVTSHGMLLCASNEDHSEVVPLAPPAGAAIGDLITVEGHASAPEPPGNRAGKAYDRVADELFVDEEGRATFKGLPFMVPAGAVTGAIKKGKIS